MKMVRKQSKKVTDFNHIKVVDKETVSMLKSLYHTYHKKSCVYKKIPKRKQKVKLPLNLVSMSLTGSTVAKATVAPIFVSITATSAIQIQAYLA